MSLYISNKPPLGYELFEWRDSVIEAAKVWFEPSGVLLKITSEKTKANIVVAAEYPRTEKHNKWYGYTFPPRKFPNIPNTNSRSAIVIHKMIKTMPKSNLNRTLRHEFGHVIGLRHNKKSVVTDIKNRPATLTDYDLKVIEKYKKYVTSYAEKNVGVRR